MNIKTISDSRRARQKIARIIRNASTIPWLQAGEIGRASIRKNFLAGGRPQKWRPRKVDVPWPPLIKSTELMTSIYNEPIQDGVALGSRKPYQAVQNFGYPPRKIAARKYLIIPKEDIHIIRNFIRLYLTGGIR